MENCGKITYQIADINIQLKTPWEQQVSNAFLPFLTQGEAFDWQVEFEIVPKIQEMNGMPLISNEVYRIYQESAEIFIRYYHNDRTDGTPYASSRMDIKQKKIKVECLPESMDRFGSDKVDFFTIGLEKILAEENAVILHAACVDTPLGGIVFSGKSGAGKSTQAALWCQYGQGKLINGDRTIIKKTDKGWYAYGSPYAGSSECYLSEHCRLNGIIFPVQAGECSLRSLNRAEAFRKILGNLTVNYFDSAFVEKAGNIALQLAMDVPVYELRCTKEEQAVLVLKEFMKKEKI